MKINPTITPGTYPNGTRFWLVACSLPSGRYKKKWASELEAKQDQGRIIREFSGGLDESEYQEAQAAANWLRTHKNPEIARLSLFELVKWGAERFHLATKAKPIAAYVEEFIKLKKSQGRRADTIREIETYMNKFVDEMGHIPLTDFNANNLGDYCASKAVPEKWKMQLKHFFDYLAGDAESSPNPNPILLKSPVHHWRKEHKERDETEHVRIWNFEEVKNLLTVSADNNTQRMFAWLVFTGMRPQESIRFWTDEKCGWNKIDLVHDVISVPGYISKTKDNREIIISPALKAWLLKYRDFTSFLTFNWRDKYTETRKKAKVSDAPDVARHTFISFMFGKGETWESVEMQAGNTKAIQKKHYARIIRDKATIPLFWDLTPDKFPRFDVPEEQLKERARANRTRAVLANRKTPNAVPIDKARRAKGQIK